MLNIDEIFKIGQNHASGPVSTEELMIAWLCLGIHIDDEDTLMENKKYKLLSEYIDMLQNWKEVVYTKFLRIKTEIIDFEEKVDT